MSDLDKLIAAVEGGIWPGPDMHDALGSDRRGELAYAAFNGSLDADLALHEALLPGHGWGAGPWGARVWLYSDHPKWDGSERHEVDMVNAPARAWLLAILRAYRQQRDGQP
ncbi:hypothetical protein [Paracoccus sp. DMF]|uniref:hypothetical protein n=1 Tax=Paracoccus sp. DMF TaxID=400837 RepID=UPI0011053D26|nr:hypothetical protein [Paracoccus sp. DMF]MCV2449407.1 hypothetical protein [Paracoccus sp. DMF]